MSKCEGGGRSRCVPPPITTSGSLTATAERPTFVPHTAERPATFTTTAERPTHLVTKKTRIATSPVARNNSPRRENRGGYRLRTKSKRNPRVISDVVHPAATVMLSTAQKAVLMFLGVLVMLSVLLTSLEPLLLPCEHGTRHYSATGRISTHLGGLGVLLAPCLFAVGWIRSRETMQEKFPELVFEVGVYYLLKIVCLAQATFFRLRHWCSCEGANGHSCSGRDDRVEDRGMAVPSAVQAYSFLQVYLGLGGCICLSMLICHVVLSKKMEISSNLLFTTPQHRRQSRVLRQAIKFEIVTVCTLLLFSPLRFAFLEKDTAFFYALVGVLVVVFALDILICVSASTLFAVPILGMAGRMDSNNHNATRQVTGRKPSRYSSTPLQKLMFHMRSTIRPRRGFVAQKARKLLGVEPSAPIMPEEMASAQRQHFQQDPPSPHKEQAPLSIPSGTSSESLSPVSPASSASSLSPPSTTPRKAAGVGVLQRKKFYRRIIGDHVFAVAVIILCNLVVLLVSAIALYHGYLWTLGLVIGVSSNLNDCAMALVSGLLSCIRSDQLRRKTNLQVNVKKQQKPAQEDASSCKSPKCPILDGDQLTAGEERVVSPCNTESPLSGPVTLEEEGDSDPEDEFDHGVFNSIFMGIGSFSFSLGSESIVGNLPSTKANNNLAKSFFNDSFRAVIGISRMKSLGRSWKQSFVSNKHNAGTGIHRWSDPVSNSEMQRWSERNSVVVTPSPNSQEAGENLRQFSLTGPSFVRSFSTEDGGIVDDQAGGIE